MKMIAHVAVVAVEVTVLVSLLFLALFGDSDYRGTPHEMSFRFCVQSDQHDKIAKLSHYRVDYTMVNQLGVDGDHAFVKEHMIRVSPNDQNPYGSYEVILPKGVYKIRVDFIYSDKYAFSEGMKLKEARLGDKSLNVSRFEKYYNKTYGFYGLCYTPSMFEYVGLSKPILLLSLVFVGSMVLTALFVLKIGKD